MNELFFKKSANFDDFFFLSEVLSFIEGH